MQGSQQSWAGLPSGEKPQAERGRPVLGGLRTGRQKPTCCVCFPVSPLWLLCSSGSSSYQPGPAEVNAPVIKQFTLALLHGAFVGQLYGLCLLSWGCLVLTVHGWAALWHYLLGSVWKSQGKVGTCWATLGGAVGALGTDIQAKVGFKGSVCPPASGKSSLLKGCQEKMD